MFVGVIYIDFSNDGVFDEIIVVVFVVFYLEDVLI